MGIPVISRSGVPGCEKDANADNRPKGIDEAR